jgi:hypothetical protein
MSNPRKLLQASRVRSELEEYLSRWDLEIRLESPPRHLDVVGTVCALLLEKLQRIHGQTLETDAYADRINLLSKRAIALWKRPVGRPSLRVVQ